MQARTILAIAMIALVILTVGCTSDNERSYNDPQYQRSYGGGCGVGAGPEPGLPPELTQGRAPEA